ncbi:MAG: TonB-dependent receptor, partial [Bryobacterales bacterium]|nr:TonB-dependent receptor [Bryobacterales bacterium]
MSFTSRALRMLHACALFAVFLPFALQAQDASGRIIGTITDPQGAVIAGAKVTITNTDTKVTRSAVTNKDGQYQVLEVPIGEYSVTAEQAGFSKTVTSPQSLLINQSLRIDVAMKVGATSDTIVIEADAANIETVVATLGQSVTQRAIVNLPLNGRNTLDLAALQPGVMPANSAAANTTGGGLEFTIAGGRPDSITYLLDGGINNNLLSNGVVFTPNPDSVTEFKLLTSNYTAEYGRNGGGIISEVIRSGTNDFHGSAYEFVRNNDFNANNFFNNLNGVGVPILKRNQFGATIGGPVLLPKIFNGRNKLFFFAAYQGQRQVSTTTNANVTTFT